MGSNSKVHQRLMMTIISLIEECSDLPDLLGIDNDLLHRLRKLDAYGQKIIASKASTFLFAGINNGELQKQINSLADQLYEKELEDEYLMRQAPYKLMQELFGMHTVEFCQRRKLLGLFRQGQHRPSYCDEETESLILQHWRETKRLNMKLRYLMIAKKINQPINSIWAVAKKHM